MQRTRTESEDGIFVSRRVAPHGGTARGRRATVSDKTRASGPVSTRLAPYFQGDSWSADSPVHRVALRQRSTRALHFVQGDERVDSAADFWRMIDPWMTFSLTRSVAAALLVALAGAPLSAVEKTVTVMPSPDFPPAAHLVEADLVKAFIEVSSAPNGTTRARRNGSSATRSVRSGWTRQTRWNGRNGNSKAWLGCTSIRG